MAIRARLAALAALALVSCAAPAAQVASPSGLAPRSPESVALAVARYTKVEAELAAADVSCMPASRREAREVTLRALHDYVARADFGRLARSTMEREHVFVDAEGRRCAVAELMHATGDDDLVASVASAKNDAHVIELAGSPRVVAWLDRAGLTAEEAARIQDPWNAHTPHPEPTGPVANVEDGLPAPRDDGAPGTKAGVAPAVPTTGGLGGGAGPERGASARSGAGSWWLWWEFAKYDLLTPARDRIDVGPLTAGTSAAATVDTMREKALASLLALRAHKDADVRESVAVALGRIGGARAVPALLELAADAEPRVAMHAFLALGATGDQSAAEALVSVVRDGTVPGGKKAKELPRGARCTAIVALGLARTRGVASAYTSEFVASALSGADRRETQDVAFAAECYASLAPDTGVTRVLDGLAASDETPAAIRGRDVERLGVRADAETVRALQQALGDREVQLRRSAAATLGDVRNDLVAPHLLTAIDLESDALTRGLGLISAGRRGGDRARNYLAEVVSGDDATLRPWAALGLGLCAREHKDAAAVAALRTAKPDASNRGAFWIARGLACDAEAVPELVAALRSSADARTRDHAAVALGMIGDPAGVRALRETAAAEKDPEVRTAIAVALALRGEDLDAAAILRTAREIEQWWLRVGVGVASGLHRSRPTVEGLQAMLDAKDTPAHALAAAADGIGLALDRRAVSVLPKLTRATNYTVMPAWFLDTLRTSL